MGEKPTILCVDDEPMILDSLTLTLGRQFNVITATSGAQGLVELKKHPEIAVVVSDMRMPNMNGAQFLHEAVQISPTSVRLLLTGETDLDSAVKAVNDGQIFRFLKKPCPPADLTATILAAHEQYKLLTAEKELLEQTLLGSISTMAEIMGLVSPVLFGRVNRIKKVVQDMARHLGIEAAWRVQIAAVVSQLGIITLPTEMVQRICLGKDLTFPELKQIEQLPLLGVNLIKHIPRLDGVVQILEGSVGGSGEAHPPAQPNSVLESAQVLRVAMLYERFTVSGDDTATAIKRISSFHGEFDPRIVEALSAVAVDTVEVSDELLLKASKLQVDMIILEDIVLPNGSLFAPRGYHVTESLVERIQNFGDAAFAKPIRVKIPSATSEAA